MPGIASPLLKRLIRRPSAGHRQCTPLTTRATPAAAGAGGGTDAGDAAGTPATGTSVGVLATADAVGAETMGAAETGETGGLPCTAGEAAGGVDDVLVDAVAGVTASNTGVAGVAGAVTRSEEHTSELQSLLRISYAVFCLKKK